jgi:DNA-binding transcriptional MerR regulator
VEYRVEQLAGRAGVSVDTVRFYQAKGLLEPPRRMGRIALYDDGHLHRLERVRALQAKGFTLATIRRLVRGELDAADEALVEAVTGRGAGAAADEEAAEEFFDLDELGARSGIPVALLQAIEREGLLVGRRHHGGAAFTDSDVAIARSGLRLLELGLPLPEVLELARDHHARVRETAERAVQLFDAHVRQPLRAARAADLDEDEAAARLVEAFSTLLPATVDLVRHHFRRTLLAVAQEHIEHVGADAERAAVAAESLRRLEDAG